VGATVASGGTLGVVVLAGAAGGVVGGAAGGIAGDAAGQVVPRYNKGESVLNAAKNISSKDFAGKAIEGAVTGAIGGGLGGCCW
jgi:hypothetical protein